MTKLRACIQSSRVSPGDPLRDVTKLLLRFHAVVLVEYFIVTRIVYGSLAMFQQTRHRQPHKLLLQTT